MLNGINTSMLFDHRETNGMPIFNSVDRAFSYEKLPYDDFISSLSNVGVEPVNEGLCSDGENSIYSLTIGDPSLPCIFVHGGIHGAHEWRCGYWLREFARQLVNPTDGDLIIRNQILSRYHFKIIPVLNPYGYINNVRQNANGVDLNRNFAMNWDEWEGTASTYKGTSPFSEVETQLVKQIIDDNDIRLYFDWHTEGGSPSGISYSTGRDIRTEPFITRVVGWTTREIEKRDSIAYPMDRQQLYNAPMSFTYPDSKGIPSAIVESGGGLSHEENAKIVLDFMWRVSWALTASNRDSRLGRMEVYGLK